VKADVPGNLLENVSDETAIKVEVAGLSAQVEDPQAPGQQIPVSQILQLFRAHGLI
jgi:hypothetical protein